jgi:MFS family permease
MMVNIVSIGRLIVSTKEMSMDTVAVDSTHQKNAFNKLWIASGVSNLADGVGLTAAPLLAAALTRDPLLVSGLVFAQRLPWFIFTLISGALVDRFDRRQVMGVTSFIRFLLLGGVGLFVLAQWMNLPFLYLVFFILGTIETLFDNAALAILPVIVPEEELESANGRLFATSTLTNELIGPSLGSFLFSLFNSSPFFFTSLAYGVSSLIFGWIPGQYYSKVPVQQKGLFLEIWEGVRWYWDHRLLRTLGFFAGTFNFVYAATMGVFVLFAQDVLGLSEAEYGFLISMGAVGGIVSSLMTKKLCAWFGPGSILFADAFLSGLAFVGISRTSNPMVVGVMFIVISMTTMFGNVIIVSLRQAIIPDHLLGRVASAYRLVVLGALPLGALFGGLIARTFNLTTPMLVGGGLLIFVAFAMQPIVNNQTIKKAKENANQNNLNV